MEYDYIKQGDCLQLMKDMPCGSVDMILTDPPYGIRLLAYSEFARILKSDSVPIVFASWKNVAVDIQELQKYFDIKNVIVWFKGGGASAT